MVPQKRIDYGFNGYQVPAIPQRPRSARRRRPSKRNGEDNETSAFDFLASLAGKLLLEGGNSSASNVNTSVDENRCADKQITHKKEPDEDDRLVKVETIDQENGLKEFAVEKIYCCKKSPSSLDSTHLGFSSGITMLDSSERSNLQDTVKWGTKNGTGSSSGGSNESLYDETLPMNNQSDNAGKASEHVIFKNEIPLLGPLSSSDKKFICEDSIHRDCFPVTGDCVKLDSRDEDGDDDENSECFLVNSPRKPFSSTPCIGGRRIRKILASKSCKVSPYQNKATVSHCDVSSKYGYYDDSDKRYRLEKNYPIKKRRYFESLSLSDYDDGTNCEAMSGSTQKFIAADDWKLNKGVQPTANNSLVKLRIKSFKVPELFVEMPETATVGSLKRTVMEAVTAILEGGLRIGVLIKGKQIRDDSKTLLQTGISQDILSESLGFCLEPNSSSQTHQFLSPDNSESLLPCSISKSLTRYSPKQSNSVESAMEHSKALVTVPPVVTPGKSKRYESAHRRIRRPFLVAEVEALVGAVEKLGTGRWRDVKTRAFDKSKHRTYVDLKDKWKTLVHTARISPQQRRGEPLPQELLDRVFKAHSYWSPKQ